MANLDKIAVDLLQDFSASGISILAADGQLKVESVKPLTNNQRNSILKLKSELLKYFHDQTKFEEHSSLSARHFLYPEPSVSDSELETLKKIYRQTISTGSQLHRCTDAEQAVRFQNFLMHHLPENFASGVIRDCEINTFNCKDDGRY